MSTVEEQARAEAEREYPAVPIAFRALTYPADAMHQTRVGAYTRGFLAGHEAATRTREVTTAAELDALPVGSVVLDADEDAWKSWRVSDGVVSMSHVEWWCADSSTGPYDAEGVVNLVARYGPFRVLHTPEVTP